MDTKCWLTLAMFLLGMVALLGFFITKKPGFGRYATSTLLLLLVVIMAGLFFTSGILETQAFINLLFAVIGFAGGLFSGKEKATLDSSKSIKPKDAVEREAPQAARP